MTVITQAHMHDLEDMKLVRDQGDEYTSPELTKFRMELHLLNIETMSFFTLRKLVCKHVHLLEMARIDSEKSERNHG